MKDDAVSNGKRPRSSKLLESVRNEEADVKDRPVFERAISKLPAQSIWEDFGGPEISTHSR